MEQMQKLTDLEKIFAELENYRNNSETSSELNWEDYEFGKNFYRNVYREKEQTVTETAFINEKLRLKPGAKILDLGCGGGRNAIELAEAGFKLTGIDLNKYALEQAEINCPANLKINFIHENILNINYYEQFKAVILIFNHFTSFDRLSIKKLLNRIASALEDGGKLLIDIPSVSHARSLDGVQEWQITNSWLSGDFKQLVLSENSFDENSLVHLRHDYCLRLADGKLDKYTQTSYLYEPEALAQLFKLFGLKLVTAFGDWQGKPYDENAEQLLIIGQK